MIILIGEGGAWKKTIILYPYVMHIILGTRVAQTFAPPPPKMKIGGKV